MEMAFNIENGIVTTGFLSCDHFLAQALGLKNDAPGLRFQRVVFLLPRRLFGVRIRQI
jgi:hypothetical protein